MTEKPLNILVIKITQEIYKDPTLNKFKLDKKTK